MYIDGCGHCSCGRLRYNAFYKREKYDLPCNYWEEETNVAEERRTIEIMLKDMSRDINDILLILKDE